MKTVSRCLALSLVPCLLSLLSGCSGGLSTEPAAGRSAAPVRELDQLESARQIFTGSPDRTACSSGLQRINAYLATHPERRPPALGAAERNLLLQRLALDAGEMGEVDSSIYTPLDAAYLWLCFLLRDTARSLEAEQLAPAEQAATAFAWVMHLTIPMDGDNEHPPEFAIRRGWAGGPERARIFLALLQQMRIPGCLIVSPSVPTPWACGALVAVEGSKEKQLVLFEHRLGLPVPGAKGSPGGDLARAYRLACPVPGPNDGQQVATLAVLRKQPELLKPLTTEEKQPYDIGPEQVKEAAVRLTPELSALTPRHAPPTKQPAPGGHGRSPGDRCGGLDRPVWQRCRRRGGSGRRPWPNQGPGRAAALPRGSRGRHR